MNDAKSAEMATFEYHDPCPPALLTLPIRRRLLIGRGSGLVEKWNEASPSVSSVIQIFDDLVKEDIDSCASLSAIQRVSNYSQKDLDWISKISADLEIMGRPATMLEGGLSQTTFHPNTLDGDDFFAFDNKAYILPAEHHGDPPSFQKSISDVGPVTASGGNTLCAQLNGLWNEVLEVYSNLGDLEQNRRLEGVLNEQVNIARGILSKKRENDYIQKRSGTQSLLSERQLSSKKRHYNTHSSYYH